MIYNNKGGNEDVLYTVHYEEGSGPGDTDDIELTAATGVIAFDEATLGKFSKVLMLSSLSEPQTTFDNDADNNSGPDAVPTSITGMFHGLDGRFACTTTNCVITKVEGGGYSVTGEWTFTPDTSDTQLAALEVSISDPDYMRFGYWTKESTNRKGEPTVEVQAIFEGTDPTTVAELQTLVDATAGAGGKATYEGPATGLYVRKEFDSKGEPEHLYHGRFTAEANLTAYFGVSEDVPVSKQNAIEGTVTDFMDGDNEVRNGWSVTLLPAKFVDAATGAVADPTDFTGGTKPTGAPETMAANGNWVGSFFGTAALDNDTDTDGNQTDYPSGVAGQFNGHFTDGHVVGAFGADRQ